VRLSIFARNTIRLAVSRFPDLMALICGLLVLPWILGVPGHPSQTVQFGWTIGLISIVLYLALPVNEIHCLHGLVQEQYCAQALSSSRTFSIVGDRRRHDVYIGNADFRVVTAKRKDRAQPSTLRGDLASLSTNRQAEAHSSQ